MAAISSPARRDGHGRGDRAGGEERARVTPGLALGHEAGEVREADGADQAGAERAGGERQCALRDARGRGGGKGPAAEQRDADQERAAEPGRRASANRAACPAPVSRPKAASTPPRRGRREPEHLLGVQDHERRERGVGADPQDLGDPARGGRRRGAAPRGAAAVRSRWSSAGAGACAGTGCPAATRAWGARAGAAGSPIGRRARRESRRSARRRPASRRARRRASRPPGRRSRPRGGRRAKRSGTSARCAVLAALRPT